MTLQEAQNSLYNFFIRNDIFDIEKHWSYVGFADTAQKEQEIKQIAALALKKYQEGGIVEALSPTVFILTKPLAHYTEPIEIYPVLATEIVNMLTAINPEKVVDPKSIKADDLADLIVFLKHLAAKEM